MADEVIEVNLTRQALEGQERAALYAMVKARDDFSDIPAFSYLSLVLTLQRTMSADSCSDPVLGECLYDIACDGLERHLDTAPDDEYIQTQIDYLVSAVTGAQVLQKYHLEQFVNGRSDSKASVRWGSEAYDNIIAAADLVQDDVLEALIYGIAGDVAFDMYRSCGDIDWIYKAFYHFIDAATPVLTTQPVRAMTRFTLCFAASAVLKEKAPAHYWGTEEQAALIEARGMYNEAKKLAQAQSRRKKSPTKKIPKKKPKKR